MSSSSTFITCTPCVPRPCWLIEPAEVRMTMPFFDTTTSSWSALTARATVSGPLREVTRNVSTPLPPRPLLGYSSIGVRGIKLRSGAKVIAMVIDEDGEDLLVVSERGVGKRTPIEEYPSKGRGGNGVLTFRVTSRSGPLTVARAVSADHELVVVSKNGIVMRTSAGSISQQGRGTQGVQVMNVDDDDEVASVARVDLAEGPDVTAEE